MDQTQPRTKKEWKKWARRQVTWDTWNVSYPLKYLYRLLNEVIWDCKKKGVVITEQEPYKELVKYFTTNENDAGVKSSSPRAVYCEATRIMNGGQLPQFIRESLQAAGWDPEKCCKILRDEHKRLPARSDIESESEEEDSDGSPAGADQDSERSPSPDIATDDESSQPSSRSSSESTENSPQRRTSTTSTSTSVSAQHIQLLTQETEPKIHQEWMEWAKRQKNPAFKDTPESAILDEVLEAVDWQYNQNYPWGRPKICKWQQPYKHLIGRWGHEGEAGPDDTPSAIDLEATRIMNKGRLPNDICQWLENAGWDAEKCCNPTLTPSEKKLSTKSQNTTEQSEQSASEDDEQHSTAQPEGPDGLLLSHQFGQLGLFNTNGESTCSPTKLIGPEKWKKDARAQKNPAFASYPYEDSRLNSYIDDIEWSGLRNKPRRIDRQPPYNFLKLQFGPKYVALHREVPPAGACEAVRIISQLNDSEFPIKLRELLANAGWDAIKCCDPSLTPEQKKLQAVQETGSSPSLSDDEEETTPERDRLRSIQQAMKSDIEKRASKTTSDERRESTSEEPTSGNKLKRPLVKEEESSPEPKRFKPTPGPTAHSSTTKPLSVSPLTSPENNLSKTLSIRESSNSFSPSPGGAVSCRESPSWRRQMTQAMSASRSKEAARSNGAPIHPFMSGSNQISEDYTWRNSLASAFAASLLSTEPTTESTPKPFATPSNITKPARTPANLNVPLPAALQRTHKPQTSTPPSPPIKTSPNPESTEQTRVITVLGDVDLTLQNAAASIAAALDAQRRQREDEKRREDDRRRAADDFRRAAERIETTSGVLGKASRNLRDATEILKKATSDLERAEEEDRMAREEFDALLRKWREGLT
ncbi:hypothetical protein CkaCkLH20_10327 [Colletotrichum karsti]|uniref:Uncharacterized protein n=1 Tax=Colletotrichum karsti TaxID=1095194 RepID=A0A9P6LH42_9PEZI|nr:uncharacterized protein CkaCkLH20_10327 [Colletotrichum karsti]KAF9872235.1 hypothetical protein CkaCkLH20_10327 [Colletotrichum karsti]